MMNSAGLACIFALACAAAAPASHAAISADRVAILPLEGLNAKAGLAPYWLPTQAQVVEAFVRLEDDLMRRQALRRPLSAYRYQVHGVTMKTAGETRVVELSAFCDGGHVGVGAAWRTHEIIVMDGGDCYFQAFYDPATKAIVRFAVNGVA